MTKRVFAGHKTELIILVFIIAVGGVDLSTSDARIYVKELNIATMGSSLSRSCAPALQPIRSLERK